MAENFPNPQEERREKNREADFNKIERIKQTLMKLEKSVISEADEGTQKHERCRWQQSWIEGLARPSFDPHHNGHQRQPEGQAAVGK